MKLLILTALLICFYHIGALASPQCSTNELNIITNKAVYDPITQITTSTTRVKVKRPLREIQLVIDPRSWSYCSPENFKETILIQPPKAYHPRHHLPMNPKPAWGGTSWSGMLYEKVSFSMGIWGNTTMFNYIQYNVSDIQRGNILGRHDFKLIQSLEGVFTNPFGFQLATGYYLVVDDGYGELSTTDQEGVYELLIVKKVKYARIDGRSAESVNKSVRLDLEPFMTTSIKNFLCCKW